MLHVKRLDSVPESAGLILDQLDRAGIKVRLLLLDREFFSVEVITMLKERNVKSLMPCRNTGNVVAVLNEFDDDKRPSVSRNTIEDGTASATYSMIITKRKKSGDGNKPVDAVEEDRPEKKFIGFATNRPGVRIELYSSRWGIETRYTKMEECRAKTRIADLAARMPVFLLLDDTVQRVDNCQGAAQRGIRGAKRHDNAGVRVHDSVSQGAQAPSRAI